MQVGAALVIDAIINLRIYNTAPTPTVHTPVGLIESVILCNPMAWGFLIACMILVVIKEMHHLK